MPFEPIAVVGRGCVLPDALDPDSFWHNVLARQLSLTPVPAGRWRVPPEQMSGPTADRASTDMGGYVRGFDTVFDPHGFAVDADLVSGLDPVFRWVLYGVRQALREAGQQGPVPRGGLVLGNLSYPSAGMGRFAEAVWLDEQPPVVREALSGWDRVRPDARNRFCSGLPAHLAARALGLGVGGYALDAACASVLYAVKLACDRLHDGTADLMIAGGVNAADDLLLHVGFSVLGAMSPSGRSRPFHRDADGLVPGEGAAFVALMRLRDAVDRGALIHGVIRGVGLSNDGCAGGLLSPAGPGQRQAMLAAYQAAGVSPETVSLVECHAAGTSLGDTVEIRSMAQVFAGCADLPIGSAKSNVGHLLAAAGGAGLLKVLGALRTGLRPATLSAEEPHQALDGTRLRLLHEAEQWPGSRRAAVSAFGFGGNNAHLIVDAWDDVATTGATDPPVPSGGGGNEPVAIVAIGARVAGGADATDFAATLVRGRPSSPEPTSVRVRLDGLRIPPVELGAALAQQVLLLEAAREAVRGVHLPAGRTTVLVGIGCDPGSARYLGRWRVGSWLDERIVDADPDAVAACRDAFAPALTADAVVGAMPNVVANRLNVHLDLTGPSLTVSAEEASGLVAVELAARALRTGEVDTAIVGAVDLSSEPVHQAALRALDRPEISGDAAVVCVLKRLTDARRDGDEVMAILDAPPVEVTSPVAVDLTVGDSGSPTTGSSFDPGRLFGHAHAAKGLVGIAVAALALRHRMLPRTDDPADPAPGLATADVTVDVLEAPRVTTRLRAGTATAWPGVRAPRLFVYSGADRAGVLDALTTDRRSSTGPARLALVVDDGADRLRCAQAAQRWLADGGVRPAGVAFREASLAGDLGFVFTSAAAAYPGMGREHLLAFPALAEVALARWGSPTVRTIWQGEGMLDRIARTSALALLHVELTRGLLGMGPDAAIGHSSGETTALIALGAWTDVPALLADARGSGLFSHELSGQCHAARRAWQRIGVEGTRWASYLVAATVQQVRAALDGEPAVHLMAINAPDRCVVGGEARACASVIERLGSRTSILLDYDLAAHAPELAEVATVWRTLHLRPTTPPAGIRFYSCASTRSYPLTSDRVADALTAQALDTIDFASTIERAWADGVRVFVEHGPQGLCTDWIRRVLGDRDHLAVSLDAPGAGLLPLFQAVAELAAAGVPINADALFAALPAVVPREYHGRQLTVPLHPPSVVLPRLTPGGTVRHPSPPPVHDGAAIEQMAGRVSVPGRVPAQPSPGSTGVALAAVMDQRRRVTELHHRFLRQQEESHTRFLRGRAHAEAVLLGAPEPGHWSRPPGAGGDGVFGQASRPGPALDRHDLELLAAGRIVEVFGPDFADCAGFPRWTALPMPPWLLVDRVTGIDAEPGVLGTGTVWTETDIQLNHWYVDGTGRLPAGLLVESGQADLLLASWMGVDRFNRGERVYRLLGCELTFHASPPTPGQTLGNEVRVTGHTQYGAVRMFSFESDCLAEGTPRLTVRAGQAGFFTEKELAASGGVRWDPALVDLTSCARPDPPPLRCVRDRFDTTEVAALAQGRPADCFGPGWEISRAHVRTPRIGAGRLRLLSEVTSFDPDGGPWERGYLRARTPIGLDDWFFSGHFPNDPCMPGNLMLDGCLQAMAFYLSATGVTLDRDGWRFEPVPERPYRVSCRAQVTPHSRLLVYQVFVRELSTTDQPVLVADVLCTVDGVDALHVGGLALRLVPDWPLDHWRQLGPPTVQRTGELDPLSQLGGLRGYRDQGQAITVEGVRFDYSTMLTGAWGNALAMVPAHVADRFRGRRAGRLPGPPYLFLTRIRQVDGTPGEVRIGSWLEAEYDVPERVWYFDQNGCPVMPFAALMEILLQPCGILTSYVGTAAHAAGDLHYRNLDGTGVVTAQVRPDTQSLRTRVELRSSFQVGETTIQTFDISCHAGDTSVFTGSATFGFFPTWAFDHQPGLPPNEAERARLDEPSEFLVDLRRRPARYCGRLLRLAGPMLLMLDRVTGFWPGGGVAGLGRLRAEIDVDADAWYFKAHFFQDPVQPGSLGNEAICQLLQFFLIETDAAAGMEHPVFEPVMLDDPITWKYRGQVVPTDELVTIEMDILETGADDRGRFARAQAWLWVDGRRIYHITEIGMRVVAGKQASTSAAEVDHVLDPAVDTWLGDHRPMWMVPTLPMMSTVDFVARAAADYHGAAITALRDLRLRRWLSVPEPVRVRTRVEREGDDLKITILARGATRSRFVPVATALAQLDPGPRPEPFEPLTDLVAQPLPYRSAEMFHGPAFQYLTSWWLGATGASGVIDIGRGHVPRGFLHPGVLDAMTHVIPHRRLSQWSSRIEPGRVAFPSRLPAVRVFEPLPDTGELRVEARFVGLQGDNSLFPIFDLQLCAEGRVLVALRLVETTVPLGALGHLSPPRQRAFLDDHEYVDGYGLSTTRDGSTVVTTADVDYLDLVPGSVADLYRLPAHTSGTDRLTRIAVADHVARAERVHPSRIEIAEDLRTAHVTSRADRRYHLDVTQAPGQATVRTTAPPESH